MEDKRVMWFAGVFAVIEGYWGILPPLTRSLLWIMILNLILRLLALGKQQKLSMASLWELVTEAVTVLVLLGVAVVLNPHIQPAIGFDVVLSSSGFYLGYFLVSVARCAAILNVPVFSQLQDAMRYFSVSSSSKSDSAGEKK